MKISIAFALAVIALATFTGCSTPERTTTTTQTTTEESSVHAATPATTSTQVIRSY